MAVFARRTRVRARRRTRAVQSELAKQAASSTRAALSSLRPVGTAARPCQSTDAGTDVETLWSEGFVAPRGAGTTMVILGYTVFEPCRGLVEGVIESLRGQCSLWLGADEPTSSEPRNSDTTRSRRSDVCSGTELNGKVLHPRRQVRSGDLPRADPVSHSTFGLNGCSHASFSTGSSLVPPWCDLRAKVSRLTTPRGPKFAMRRSRIGRWAVRTAYEGSGLEPGRRTQGQSPDWFD